jgi:hypothetical protein
MRTKDREDIRRKEKSGEYRRDFDVGSKSMGRRLRCNRF